MKKILILAGFAALQILSANAQAEEYCREYTQTFTIGNTTQKGYGTACLQPDGSWEIQTPANAAPVNTVQPVVVQQPITYVVRDTHTYFVPDRPFRDSIIITDRRLPRHHRW